jgi:hypothetical protein
LSLLTTHQIQGYTAAFYFCKQHVS